MTDPASPATAARPFDIVVFGATGFVGRLIAEYLDRHAPPQLRLALAGRSADRLAALAAGLTRTDIGILTADVDDPASLQAMASRARVVLTTVGPYTQLGEPVVAACVAAGADYLDLTGEPGFVDRVRARYHEVVVVSGSLVVHCCGFDSIPADLGVLFTLQQLPRGVPVTIEGFFAGDARFSGGTFASALGVIGEPRPPRTAHPKPEPGQRVVRRQRERVHFQRELGRWAAPMPTIDPQIVLRSARARDDYGPEFRYGHYLTTRSLLSFGALAVGVGAVALLARTAPTRALLQRLRPPGSGPDEATRKRSWYRITFLGRAGGVHVVTCVEGGDPGYDETARMAGESALCLASERAALPHRGGVLTTATAMGEPLLARLQAAGMQFRVLEGGRVR